MSWHTLSSEDAMKNLSTSIEGLLHTDVQQRLTDHGLNQLPTKKSDPWWLVLLRQFASPLIIVLVFAALVSAFLREWIDTSVIAAAVVVNTAIGFIQEYKANRALEHLRSLIQPQASVIRDGQEQEISAQQLVPGDILVLRTGDQVTADARVVQSFDLVANESTLTGESMPIKKSAGILVEGTLLAEQTNMLFAGTTITGGRGFAVVTETGKNTELGKISTLVSETEELQTPLQEQLAVLARWISMIVGVILVVLFVIGILRGESVAKMFEMSVALAVAAIPEGLLVSVTIILAIGMQRILRRRSLVRRLVGAETLGSVSVICSDKTGTITEGEMRVTDIETSKSHLSISDAIHSKDEVVKQLFYISALCNDAKRIFSSVGPQMKGSPTERALLQAAFDYGLNLVQVDADHTRIAEIPFDSRYKFMVTKHVWNGGNRLLLKGAPQYVLDRCSQYLDGDKECELTDELKKQWLDRISTSTKQGLRTLAFASKIEEGDSRSISQDSVKGFIFLGYMGLRDPLRAKAKDEIAAAKRAGVRTVIITGDDPETARAIAAEAGLEASPDSVVIGSQLDKWSDHELEKRVSKISVFARVEPRHKIRIVNAWQARGEVVAMTGDGVNDAPALKAADIGIAVGSGTDVAKQASDVVILNNDLGTISAAIEEGRVIFDNIRKVSVYLIAGSFTEVFLIGFAMLAHLPAPLLAIQILWINFFADSFPHIGLALEKKEGDVMSMPPRERREPVLNSDMITMIIIIAVVINAFSLGFFVWLMQMGHSIEFVRTMMFVMVGIDTLFFVFCTRTFRKSIFRINPFSNFWLLGGVSIGFIMMIAATAVPFLQFVFEIIPLSLSNWGLLLIIALLKVMVIEVGKEVFILRKLAN